MNLNDMQSWTNLTNMYQSEEFWKQVLEGKPFLNNMAHVMTCKSINDSVLKCDLFEEDGFFVLEAEVPGVNLDGIQIQYTDEFIVLKGQFQSHSGNRTYYLKERQNQFFEKKILLPFKLQTPPIREEMRSGVLQLYFRIS